MSPEEIFNNNTLYAFLIYYFLEDLPSLETEDQWTISQHMAAWLPYEKHLTEILQKLEDLRAAADIGKADA